MTQKVDDGASPAPSGRRSAYPTDRTPGSAATRSATRRASAPAAPAWRRRCISGGGSDRHGSHRYRGQLPRVEAGVHVEQPIEALAEQPRAHQKQHRDRELRHYEVRPEAPPARSRGATAAFLEPRGRFRGPIRERPASA